MCIPSLRYSHTQTRAQHPYVARSMRTSALDALGVHPYRIEGEKEVHACSGERQRRQGRGGMRGGEKRSSGERELRAPVGFRIVYQCAQASVREHRGEAIDYNYPNTPGQTWERATPPSARSSCYRDRFLFAFSPSPPLSFLPGLPVAYTSGASLSRVQAMGRINCSLAGVDDCQVNSCAVQLNTLELRIGIRI